MSLVRAPLTDTDSESDRERDEPSNNNNDRNVNNSNSHVPISPVAIVQASNARKRAREKSQAERERKRRKKDEAKIDKNKAKINKKSRKRKAKSNIKKVATASTTSSDSKIEKRINENPDHSLCNLDNTLYCQACCQSISTHKGNCDSHLLCDHHNRVALPNWKARRSGKTQSSISSIQRRKETLKDIGTDSVVAACISGIGGSEICKYNQLMHNKYRFRNGRGLVTDPSSFSGKLQQARERVDEVITKWIDREKPFNIIVDECDDESKPGERLVNVTQHYHQTPRFALFPQSLANYADAQLQYDDTFILKTMSNAFKHFAAHHGKHFDHKHQFMLFYENCRVFDPSYRNKPATVDIATQHIPWGYDCYRKKPAIQKALSKDYERYLRNTRDIVDKPKYLKHWWKSNEREYKYLSVIALRCLNALRGGCDVERSFNHFSKMNRSGNAATMGPLNKEVRTMCHWNKELIANGLFDLTSL
eukprot:254208_1